MQNENAGAFIQKCLRISRQQGKHGAFLSHGTLRDYEGHRTVKLPLAVGHVGSPAGLGWVTTYVWVSA